MCVGEEVVVCVDVGVCECMVVWKSVCVGIGVWVCRCVWVSVCVGVGVCG